MPSIINGKFYSFLNHFDSDNQNIYVFFYIFIDFFETEKFSNYMIFCEKKKSFKKKSISYKLWFHRISSYNCLYSILYYIWNNNYYF